MITGTIQSAVKLQVLDTAWQQKKKELNTKKSQEEMTADERMLENLKEQMEKERESNSHADTYNKLKTGGKLTAEEISYLERSDPEALRKYREDQAEKAAYEKELKNCRTKEDAERLKMNKLGNFAVQAKKISTDPYIPLDKKLELMNQLNDKVCLINEAHQEFVKSQQYKDMPKDYEVLEEATQEAVENLEDIQNEVRDDGLDESKQNSDRLGADSRYDAENKNTLDETAEEKMRKASAERKPFDDEDEAYTENNDVFSALSKEIMSYILSFDAGHGKIDVSL